MYQPHDIYSNPSPHHLQMTTTKIHQRNSSDTFTFPIVMCRSRTQWSIFVMCVVTKIDEMKKKGVNFTACFQIFFWFQLQRTTKIACTTKNFTHLVRTNKKGIIWSLKIIASYHCLFGVKNTWCCWPLLVQRWLEPFCTSLDFFLCFWVNTCIMCNLLPGKNAMYKRLCTCWAH